jgi:hypothetical protein
VGLFCCFIQNTLDKVRARGILKCYAIFLLNSADETLISGLFENKSGLWTYYAKKL